ncbi:MAG: hypothetical protein AAB320_06035 [Elusimicrobiota bacterium]
MNILALALLASRCAVAAQTAPVLLPLKDSPGDWAAAKYATNAAFDRITAADEGSKRPIAKIRELVAIVEKDERAETERQTEFFRKHPVEGAAFKDLKARVEFVFEARMWANYGWFMPVSFNEVAAESGQPASRFPGVPLKTFTTDVQYCEQFSRYGAQINKLIDGIDPGFKPRKHAIGACTL